MSILEYQLAPNYLSARFPGSWLHVVRGPRQTLPQILSDWPRALFVANGTMFESTAGHDRFGALDRELGVNHSSTIVDEGATIAVVGGRAVGAYGGRVPAGASVALQGWPSLVINGRPVYHPTAANNERVWRSGLGSLADGRVLYVALVGSLAMLSDRMAELGAVVAGYLDGGHSQGAELRGVGRRVHTAPDGAAVPTWVLAMPAQGDQGALSGQNSSGSSAATAATVGKVLAGIGGALALGVAARAIFGGDAGEGTMAPRERATR